MLSSKKCRPPASPSSQQPLSFPPRIGSQTRQPSPPGIGESQYPGRNPIGASHGATDSYLSKGSSSELLSQDQPFSRELKLPVCAINVLNYSLSNSLCVQFITNYSLSAYYLLYGRRSVCSSTGSAWGDFVWGAVWGVLYLVYAFDVSLLKESELGSSQLSNLEAGWSAIQLGLTFFLSPWM